MKRLLIPIALHADEHLPAAITRAAALNGRVQPSEILTDVGIRYVRAEGLPGQSHDTALPVATFLGVDRDSLVAAYHPKRPNGMIDFFGADIRFRHHLGIRRRIAPTALKELGYVKALWQVRPLPFDTRSLEKTICFCPVCTQPLGYTKTYGLWACESCVGHDEYGMPLPTVDLRDFPQPILTVNDRDALDFVVSLIDPDPLVRGRAPPALHDDLKALSRGELFEFAVSLCCVRKQDLGRATTSVGRPRMDDGFEAVFTPDALASAGRAIMRWPAGFDELCEEARKDTHKRGHHGVKAELGQIACLSSDRTISEKSRKVFAAAIRRNMSSGPARAMRRNYRGDSDLRTSTDLAKLFGFSNKTLSRLLSDPSVESYTSSSRTGPKLFRLSEIQNIVHRKELAEPASSVGRRLGVPLDVVAEIADAGLIKRETGPVLQLLMCDANYYDRQSVDSLISRLEKKARREVPTLTTATGLLWRWAVLMARNPGST